MALRLRAMGQPNYVNAFEVTLQPQTLVLPLTWRKPRTVFVNSMSDLFHEAVPDEYVKQVFDVMERAPRHVFQVLTKRSERLKDVSKQLVWPDNIWMGVSVEGEAELSRVDHLRATNAKVKFLSLEPLLGSLPSLDLAGIDWVIVGGESGPGAREMKEIWAVEILRKCRVANVPFFFKQWGGVNKKRAGRTLLHRTWDEYPAVRAKGQSGVQLSKEEAVLPGLERAVAGANAP